MAHHPYLVGLVGTGVGPSLTPALHMAEARAQGLDYVYRTIDLNAARRRARADRRGARLGAHARLQRPQHHPPVQAAGHRAPRRRRRRRRRARRRQHRGLRRTRAPSDTTPTPPGFALGFAEGLPGAATDNVVLIGAGGAGAAVGDALLRLGADHLTIVDVDVERATALANELSSPASRGPGRRVVARQAAGAAARQRRRRALHADRNGRTPGPAVRRRAAAPRAVGGRHRLPAAGHRTARRGAGGRLPTSATAATWPCTRPPRPSN